MEKIITKEKKTRKERRNKIILGIFLVSIMVLGTAGYAFFSGSGEEIEKEEYAGIEFVLKENGLWNFEIQNFQFATTFTPKDTENISTFIFKTANDYYKKPLFFVGQGIARQELERNLVNFVSWSQDACLENYESEECMEDAPTKTCEDNIIIIKEAEKIEINEEENCVFILSPVDEQTRVADALLFKVLGLKSGMF